MRRLIVALTLTLAGQPALAGGMAEPVSEPAVIAAPAPAGDSPWYAYGLIGAGRADHRFTYAEFGGTSFTASGAMLAAGLGRVLTRGDGWTLGVEGDLSLGTLKQDIFLAEYPCKHEGCAASIKGMATLRAVAARDFGATRVFATAGLAAGRAQGQADRGDCDRAGECAYDETLFGWSAGIGALRALGENWSLRGDILYTSLGRPDFHDISTRAGRIGVTQIRLGAQYDF
ncbi:MAG: outer membrane beta-barrel protein [Paracoccaceae bacterium]